MGGTFGFVGSILFIPQAVYCWGSILERKELATLTGRAPELCGWALSSSYPPLGRAPELCQLCGWALWLNLLLLLSSSGLCGWALCPGLVLLLSSSWPRP